MTLPYTSIRPDMRSSEMRNHRVIALAEIVATFPCLHEFGADNILGFLKNISLTGHSESLTIFSNYILAFPTLASQLRGIMLGFQHDDTWKELTSRLLKDYSLILSSGDSRQSFRLEEADGIFVRNTASPVTEEKSQGELEGGDSLLIPEEPVREQAARPFMERSCLVAWCECILDLVSRNPTQEYNILELMDHFNSMYPKVLGSKWEQDRTRRGHFIKSHNTKIAQLLAPYGLCIQTRLNPIRIRHAPMLYSFPPVTKSPEPEFRNNGRPLRKRTFITAPEESRKKPKEAQDFFEKKPDTQVEELPKCLSKHRKSSSFKVKAGSRRNDSSAGRNDSSTSRTDQQSKLAMMKSAYDLLKSQTELHIQYFDLLVQNLEQS